MGSKFCAGFEKTSGVVGAVAKPVGWLGKKAIKAGGGVLNVGLTGLGALTEGLEGYSKMTAAAQR